MGADYQSYRGGTIYTETATIYTLPSSCPSINENCVRDARWYVAFLVLSKFCMWTCRL